LSTAVDRAVATAATDALVAGDLAEAVRALGMLPPVVRADSASPTVSASDARKRVLELILNRIGADRIERAARVEAGDPTLTEREMLQYRIDQLDQQQEADPSEKTDEPADEVAALRAKVAQLEARLGEIPQIEETASSGEPKEINSQRDKWDPYG